MTKTKTILISGAGICGLATALACIKQGFQVKLFEKNTAINEYGAGLQITPNGATICRWLEIDDLIRKEAFIPQQLKLNDQNDNNIFTIPIANRDRSPWSDAYYQIHRATFINILAGKYAEKCADSTNELLLDAKVASYVNQKNGIKITLDDGREFSGELLIIAQGINSNLRKQISPHCEPLYSQYLSWRCLARTEDLNEQIPAPSTTIRIGAEKHCVSYLINQGNIVNFVGATKSQQIPVNLHSLENPTTYLSEFNAFPPIIKKIIAKGYNYRVSALFVTPATDKWFDGRAILLGDAAHTMLPFMAQGANMALEDAAAIAKTIHNIATDNSSYEQALNTFVNTRQPRIEKLIHRSNNNANMFHQKNIIVAKAMQKTIKFGHWLCPSIIKKVFSEIYDYNILSEPRLTTSNQPSIAWKEQQK